MEADARLFRRGGAGLIAMSQLIKPNFLIVGAARSGTTSLFDWLRGHPQIFMPAWKEPSYFVDGYGLSDWDKYLTLFAPGRGKKAIGEASAAYLAAPESPPWIQRELGTPRIIMILRDPVRRAMSLYAWMTMEGYEPAPSFEAALDAEPLRMADPAFARNCPQYFWDYCYFHSGLYAEQVERHLDTFGRGSVRIYLFEDLVEKPGEVLKDVCGFLDVDTNYTTRMRPSNRSRIPRLPKVQRSLRRELMRSHHLPHYPGLAARRCVAAAMALNRWLGRRPVMPREIVQNLRAAYSADVKRLQALIGRELSSWLPTPADDAAVPEISEARPSPADTG